MWEFDSEFSEIIRRTPSVRSFRFPIKANDVTFQAGQYFYLKIQVGAEIAEHHFSFSNSPTEKGYIEFTKKITQHPFSQALSSVAPGTWAHLKGPEGEFVLPKEIKKVAFLSGGIGITPIRSILKYISDEKLNWDIKLLYGNKNIDEIIFKDELDDFSSKNPLVRVFHILSEPPATWRGKTGIIDKALIQELVPDYKERLFYTSGPPGMVTSLENQLLELNLPDSQLKHDNFTGY